MQMKSMQRMASWFADLEQEAEPSALGNEISDYLLGPFDEVRLGEDAPETSWQDWCPPPIRTAEELQALVLWVQEEIDKRDLYPNPDTYPFDDYYDREDYYVCKF